MSSAFSYTSSSHPTRSTAAKTPQTSTSFFLSSLITSPPLWTIFSERLAFPSYHVQKVPNPTNALPLASSNLAPIHTSHVTSTSAIHTIPESSFKDRLSSFSPITASPYAATTLPSSSKYTRIESAKTVCPSYLTEDLKLTSAIFTACLLHSSTLSSFHVVQISCQDFYLSIISIDSVSISLPQSYHSRLQH